MGTGWRGIRTAEARAVQTRPTAKGRGAAEEVDTYFYLGLLLLPQTFVLYKTDILRECVKVPNVQASATTAAAASSSVFPAGASLTQPMRPTTYS